MLWNYIVTPIYFGMPREAVAAMLIPGILPFNVLKCAMNAGITLFLYKPMVTLFRRGNLVEKSRSGQNTAFGGGMIIIGAFIVITAVFFIFCYQGMI